MTYTIPILIVIPLLAGDVAKDASAHASLISHLPGPIQALMVASVIAGIIFVGSRFSHHLFRAIAKTNLREIFTALSLALVLGVTILMQLVGVSPALGAFIAGVVLANSEYRRTLETDIEPFKGLLLGLFFISVGMGIDFGLLADSPLAIPAAVAGLLVIKATILYALGRVFRMTPRQNMGFAFALSQGGEFAFVLFQFAGGIHILSPEQVKFLTLVVALSIAATPLVMLWYTKMIVPKFMTILPERAYDQIEEKNAIILAGFGRFGQVIGRFLIAQGIKITVLEKDPDQVDLIRKFGFKGYFGDAARLDLLHSAGAAKAKLFIVAVDDVGNSLDIIRMAKAEFPKLTIFARARNRQHAYDLHKLGVHYFKRETFDSSLDMAKEIMMWLGKKKPDVERKAEKFRLHDEETLKKSFEFFEDEPTLINYAKTQREELEQILRNDAVG